MPTVNPPLDHKTQWPDIRHNELYIGGQPLSRLAAQMPQTPFYAYDRQLIAQRIAELRRLLPAGIQLHYALKANPMPALVNFIAPLVDGFDVASHQEMLVAINGGKATSEISFAGPGKTRREIRAAVAAGIVINAESFAQIDQAARAGVELGVVPRIAVRLNPEFELKSSGMRMTGGAKPFGIDTEQFPELIEKMRGLDLEPEGLHLYTGSQNLNPAAICEAQQAAISLACELIERFALRLRFINIGGGFGIPYFPGESPLDLRSVADQLYLLQKQTRQASPKTTLVLELGRYLVGEAGIYVCRVLERKTSRGTVYLITNGGLHHHLANSGNFGQVLRKNYPVLIGNRVEGEEKERVTIVGPLCTPLDILAEKVLLPKAQPGDWVVVRQSGAYGLTASPQQFLGHPPAIEVLIG
ncbi:pyridoxal-dependent decarboxylase, exosortase A system-associated [Marinobacterium sedimentorum]|uniref:pyridoxal-dependent decarboxylase, exosortase A system-associated n=1 Tax=Marinobacterium sedimentorum TaxID=2927804 RepID=UPI0020C6805D|nr:pyridoxal-dependent decarboxylase, exosortase A system-associated [Marinobacterium sedimentorum]MCP8686792.1 pyridoxal-dependent decarboxylase, exosortase A system-associated [Marinobacterium sedimentorum]